MKSETLHTAGYHFSPNNIYSLPGRGFYATQTGVPTVNYSNDARLSNEGKIEVWKTKLYNRPKGCGNFKFSISGIVATFDTLNDFQSWCEKYGMKAEKGLPSEIMGD